MHHHKDKKKHHSSTSSSSSSSEDEKKRCHKKKLTDEEAKAIAKLWAKFLPEVTIITLPSKAEGVLTLSHAMKDIPDMRINNLVSKSPLANYALFSTEVSKNKWINLYEVMIPDIPGEDGHISTSQFYVNQLHDQRGLDVAGVHFHWTGGSVYRNDHLVTAVHHQSTSDLGPVDFSKKTIRVLLETQKLLQRKGLKYYDC